MVMTNPRTTMLPRTTPRNANNANANEENNSAKGSNVVEKLRDVMDANGDDEPKNDDAAENDDANGEHCLHKTIALKKACSCCDEFPGLMEDSVSLSKTIQKVTIELNQMSG